MTHPESPACQSGNCRRHTASQLISCPPELVYEAFIRPDKLVQWLPPKGAVGRILAFEPRRGGRLEMTLTFEAAQGKNIGNTDVVKATFVDLTPGRRIVLAVSFPSSDQAFAGTMTMTWTFERQGGSTVVTIVADDVPAGISRDDHEMGMRSTLENLQRMLRCNA